VIRNQDDGGGDGGQFDIVLIRLAELLRSPGIDPGVETFVPPKAVVLQWELAEREAYARYHEMDGNDAD
jgi:hypothetical protein